ncbi:16S rRNA processing protein RimM [Halopolyspora algeriensis]|uniref:Ribosome maturation factor RimM n=1 Tax=Halopolyspora algeriensis TaxID=1500506 RepID=A0A368VF00_9ACTN|nr:ribosome maturation factor RimM [Halopolyspora algeriensis]RCW39847.1 16S rRNA processing protein RimM [Halopolyspora algeriensis]TQM56502.1 16S rRNA processing protein RimM [Halopolyspora algeriensis]
MTDQEPRRLVVGRVVKPHGVQGELVVEVRTDSPEQRFRPGAVLGVRRQRAARSRLPEELVLSAARPHAGRLLVRAEEVDSRAAAEELRGVLLTVSADDFESGDDPDEFHDRELEGLRAVLVTGEEVGVVQEVVHTPAGELLQVSSPDGRESLVPFVSDIVPEVDVEQGRVLLDPPEGLLGEV